MCECLRPRDSRFGLQAQLKAELDAKESELRITCQQATVHLLGFCAKTIPILQSMWTR